MTPIYCCGFECGVNNIHWTLTNGGTAATMSTSRPRTGTRSLSILPSGSLCYALRSITNTVGVIRFYVYFDSFFTTGGTNEVRISCWVGSGGVFEGQLIYDIAAQALRIRLTGTGGSTGSDSYSVSTGVWYRIDMRFDVSGNPWTLDAQVNGTPFTQITRATAASSLIYTAFGVDITGAFGLFYVDDVLESATNADYPLGAGYVSHFVPTSDGTHNIAGTNDFEIGTGGTDILNATTTAYQLVDDVPMQSGAIGTTDFINMVLPTAATQYVECVFGPAPGVSTPTVAPRAVEAIVGVASAGGAANNMEVRLNDNGTMGTIYTHTGVTLTTTITHTRVHFSDPPSAATSWVIGGGGNGDFTDLRIRFGSPAVLDVNPDGYFASAMIEAEFEEVVVPRRRNTSIGHPFIF